MREMSVMNFRFYVPTRVLFGSGQLNNLHKQKMPGEKALVVTSEGKSVKEYGILDRVLNQLETSGVETIIFNKVKVNPEKKLIEAGAEMVRKSKCDFLVAVGGGSVIDSAKIIGMYGPQSGELWDYVAGATGKRRPLEKDPLPVIAIPTTAGTGSEVDQWGVITNDETNEKIGCGGMESLFPVIAIVDPELMRSVPSKLTTFQGFDALFHSTEGYISQYANIMSEMVEIAAIENIGKYLPRAVEDPHDMVARERVAFASTMSGYSMVVSTCISKHAIEHAMSALHSNLPHGAGLIMISEEYYKLIINKHVCDERFVDMARALGIKNAHKPEDFIDGLTALQEKCGVRDLKMSDYGIQKKEIVDIVKIARETMGQMFKCDPVKITDEECEYILEKSYR